MKEVEQC